jgi:hypothetical protein
VLAFSAAVTNVFRYNDRTEFVSGTPPSAEHWVARVAARLGLRAMPLAAWWPAR